MVHHIDQALTALKFGYALPESPENKCYVKCGLGDHSVVTTLRALKRTLKKRGTYTCGKCISSSVEGRNKRKDQAMKLWADPIKAKLISDKAKLASNSDEGRKQRSLQAKEAWKSESYSSFQTRRLNDLLTSESHRNLVSACNRKSYANDPEKYIKTRVSALFREDSKEKHLEAVNSQEYKNTQRELALKRFQNSEYKTKIAKGLENFPRGGKMSSPEKAVKSILDSLSINYIYNKALGPYNFDFYIESSDLFIEVQGEYWHSIPNNERRDKSKYTYLRSASPNSRIVYIWDYDFNSGNAEYKLKQALGMSVVSPISFNFDQCSFIEIDKEEAKIFLNTWHYAQYGKAAKNLYGVKLNDITIAISKIGPVGRKETATSLGYSTKECFELDRFCIHPMYQKKNLGSWLLGRTINEFFKSHKDAVAIVSFADSTFGHDGTIYKASNWKTVGTVKPDHIYLSEDGWILHKKTVYNQAASLHMSESAYAEKHGYVKVKGKEKTKFLITRSGR
jgi:hypothetical protein